MSRAIGESDVSSTDFQTTRTDGYSPHGSREIPEASSSSDVDRSEKSRCHSADMHAFGKLLFHERAELLDAFLIFTDVLGGFSLTFCCFRRKPFQVVLNLGIDRG